MKGKWCIADMPGHASDVPDIMDPAYVLFDGTSSREFAFGCVIGTIDAVGDAQASSVEFSWNGNDEMDAACGEGWAEIRLDGSAKGQILFLSRDNADFTARPCNTISTRC